MTKTKTLIVTAAAVIALSGCGAFDDYNDDRGKGDAPVGERHESPRQIWQNVDGFPNLIAYCIGANGAYTTTRESPPVIVKDDANCAEGGQLYEP